MFTSVKSVRDHFYLIPLSLAWLIFATTTHRMEHAAQQTSTLEMQVAIPAFIQVILSGGDRYLATNITVFRALTVNTQDNNPDRFVIQSKIQTDAASLNPFHEDNYYLAAANLSWTNQLDSAQEILIKASNARSFDMLPPFYCAFNEYYFRHDTLSGAKWLQIASQHSSNEEDKIALAKLAAKWISKGTDRRQALNILKLMANQSRYSNLRRQIMMRADQLNQMITIDEAIAAYTEKFHRPPSSVEDLVSSRILQSHPNDPFGQSYIIDSHGMTQVQGNKKHDNRH